LYLVDDDSVILTHSNYQAINIGNSKPLSERDKCGLAAWVATTGKVFCSNNGEYKKHPAWSGEIEHLQLLESGACRHLLIMPITTLDEDHILGVVSFENKKGFSAGFDDDDQSLVQYMARHIAMAKRKVDRKGMIETWERWGLEDDLHELLNWQVLGVVAHLEAASTYLVQERYNKLHAMIPKILHNAKSAANEIKSVHSMTLSQYLEIQNIKLALEKIRDMWVERIDQNRKLASIPVLCPPNLELPAPVRIVLLKVASNALLNAIEYSGALEDNNIRVQVSVTRNDDRVSLCVEDSGHGQHPLPKGYGITRMEQLVEQINQNKEIPYRLELELYSYPNKGTKVTLRARASRK
jgi:signal transduction histidine kinase